MSSHIIFISHEVAPHFLIILTIYLDLNEIFIFFRSLLIA